MPSLTWQGGRMLELIGRAHAQVLPTLTFITSTATPGVVIVSLLKWLLVIVAALAVVYLVYGGIMYITAGGNPEQATKARTAIINAIIGIVIILASFLIVNWVSQFTNTVR